MIGFQEYCINNNVSVIKLAKEIGIQPGTIWGWFNVNRVPNKYHEFLINKFGFTKEYINNIVNDINTHHPKKKGFNSYEIHDDITIIFLKKKDGRIFETIIDTEDLERIKNLDLSWNAAWDDKLKQYYAQSVEYYIPLEGGNKKVRIHYLHRDVVNAQKDDYVDHENHDTLDNRKINLRVTKQYKNTSNRKGANKNNHTTGVRNVHYIKRTDEYWVQVQRKGVRYKYAFPSTQFKEACICAENLRNEVFGEFCGEG